MLYRLIQVSSSRFWKQTTDALTHTLTFRKYDPELEAQEDDAIGMMSSGDVLTQRMNTTSAMAFVLGELYDVTVDTTPADPPAP